MTAAPGDNAIRQLADTSLTWEQRVEGLCAKLELAHTFGAQIIIPPAIAKDFAEFLQALAKSTDAHTAWRKRVEENERQQRAAWQRLKQWLGWWVPRLSGTTVADLLLGGPVRRDDNAQ